jgi:hypothetical protein
MEHWFGDVTISLRVDLVIVMQQIFSCPRINESHWMDATRLFTIVCTTYLRLLVKSYEQVINISPLYFDNTRILMPIPLII